MDSGDPASETSGVEFHRRVWESFLLDRGVDVDAVAVRRLDRGEVNDNWRIDGERTSWVLRHYRSTVDPAELDCELAAVDRLARAGFPTPPPVLPARADEPSTWEMVDGRPAALFPFVAGVHPPERDGGYGSLDLELGLKAARLAAAMHKILDGEKLPGRRQPARDAWHQIGAFLAGPLAEHPLFGQLIGPLGDAHTRLADLYRDPADVPTGLVHNDITPPNLLLDPDIGDVVALLDFDDCAQTLLLYDLGSIVSVFGKDQRRRIDLRRIVALVNAYASVRHLTPRERMILPDVLAAHAAAVGIHVLGNWLSAGRQVQDPMDSYSAQQFLDLIEARSALRRSLRSG